MMSSALHTNVYLYCTFTGACTLVQSRVSAVLASLMECLIIVCSTPAVHVTQLPLAATMEVFSHSNVLYGSTASLLLPCCAVCYAIYQADSPIGAMALYLLVGGFGYSTFGSRA